jgi:hypothetical protein
MKPLNVSEQIRLVLDPKKPGIKARLFVGREDGITVYDSIQDKTTTSVAALVSGVWQASEALMSLTQPSETLSDFRLGFDNSSQGIYLFPFTLQGKRFFLGAIYRDCVNPGQLKRQIALIKEEMDRVFAEVPMEAKKTHMREGYLFKDISDEEMDRLFSAGGI